MLHLDQWRLQSLPMAPEAHTAIGYEWDNMTRKTSNCCVVVFMIGFVVVAIEVSVIIVCIIIVDH